VSRVRVLVVDDSAFMRGAIARLLAADPRFEVVGQARDGQEAVHLAQELRPDVITMDFNMPGLNGADATRAILARRAAPIVMLSAHTREGAAATVEALAAGAVDFVAKPGGEVSPTLSEIRDELTKKLIEAAGARVLRSAAAAAPVSSAPRNRVAQPERSGSRSMPPGLRVVVIACSTGGPAALVRVIPMLRLAKGAALIIVQHMPVGFTAALADQLSERSPFKVREARAGDQLEGGLALVAPGGKHLVLDRGGNLRLDESAPVHGVRPAADVTLKSAALAYGPRAIGVVLTGMGRDGALGLAAIKAAGGRTVAQDRESSTVYGMPKAAVELGVVEEISAVDHIGTLINRLIG
jgi:two-component system, chemotaxis family, protein-glutamate methylesterase/glutaminase